MKYIVYDERGVIQCSGECPDVGASFDHFAPCQVLQVEEVPRDLQNWVVENEALQQRLGRPSGYHVWEADAARWVADTAMIRRVRAQLLAATDWTQLPDVPEKIKSAYLSYRQALRDISGQPGYPEVIDWPEKPS